METTALPSSPDNAPVITVAHPFPRAEEVFQILARGLCELVMDGCKPEQPKRELKGFTVTV